MQIREKRPRLNEDLLKRNKHWIHEVTLQSTFALAPSLPVHASLVPAPTIPQALLCSESHWSPRDTPQPWPFLILWEYLPLLITVTFYHTLNFHDTITCRFPPLLSHHTHAPCRPYSCPGLPVRLCADFSQICHFCLHIQSPIRNLLFHMETQTQNKHEKVKLRCKIQKACFCKYRSWLLITIWIMWSYSFKQMTLPPIEYFSANSPIILFCPEDQIIKDGLDSQWDLYQPTPLSKVVHNAWPAPNQVFS